MFKMFSDNYGYLIVQPGTRLAACIDPGEGKAVLEACKELNLELCAAWCTHKHADHVGGVTELKRSLPSINVIGTRYEEIPYLVQPVGDGEVFYFGDLVVRVLYTPCHTRGHVLYYVERSSPDPEHNQPILFSGDTLFVGGCGRFFEGNAADMLANMQRIATLPRETQVFCAHEYTEGNYKFLNSIDADTCGARYAEIKALRDFGQPTVPSTLGEEVAHNLFMRCEDLALQAKLGATSAEEAMKALREMKNNFS
jgi:hydroxyacylglutathione hydrolase